MIEDMFFGTDAQQAQLRKGRALFDLIRDDPAFSYYGRAVGMVRPLNETPDRIARLIALQGSASFTDITGAEAAALVPSLEARGLSVTHYDCLEGADSALAAADATLATRALPDDIRVHEIDADAPEDWPELLAEVSLGCGILPIAGSVLRGLTRPGLGLVAVDAAGRPVSCAAAAAYAHPDHPIYGTQAWWGMLATDPARRGQKLALILGAMTMRRMQERFGFARFMTGVQPGNAASESVCHALGLTARGRIILTLAETASPPGGKPTG